MASKLFTGDEYSAVLRKKEFICYTGDMQTEIEDKGKSPLHCSEDALKIEVDELTVEMKKQNSRKRIFWDGVVKGFGYAVGATVLFSILVAIVGFIVKNTDVPFFESIVQWFGLSVS